MATLYIVGTPIGNLEDITLRALSVLKKVDKIAAEDTRHTRILLDRYQIDKPLISYHKFNLKERTRQIVSEILSGRDIALVSDAGTPGISDPGYELVVEAVKAGVKVVPIPNTSAFLTALSASGISIDRFIFDGFIPVKGPERKRRLEDLKNEQRTIVLYEAPHRILKTLKDIYGTLGDRNICIARELTKKFEEFTRSRISEQIKRYSTVKPKGEFVLIIEGDTTKPKEDIEGIKMLLAGMLDSGVSRKDAVKMLSRDKKIPKNKLYKMALDI